MTTPKINRNGPPAAVSTPAAIQHLLTRYRVPASFLAAAIGITSRHLYRITSGRAPFNKRLQLAVEAVQARWATDPPKYVHPNSRPPAV